VDGPPIEESVIEIERGRISRISSGPEADADHLGNVAVVPGLVNAHTHLEFSDLRRPLAPASPFPQWIRAVIAHRRQRTAPLGATIDRGLRECRSMGTTLLGEIATDDISTSRFFSCFAAGTVFREVLGLADEIASQQLDIARQHLSRQHEHPELPVTCGLSPHAPYSVSAELFLECIQLATQAGAPVAMHLAETREELELLERGSGPFADFLGSLGVWRDRFWMPDGTVQAYLEVLARAPRGLIVHGNYLTRPDIAFLAQHPQLTVVYCPRTHHFFGHEAHPWRDMLEAGVSVALGTDSRASNPDLSVWHEVQFLRQAFDDVLPQTLLELATIRGAAALGTDDQTGTLTPGKSADLAIIRLSDDAAETSAEPFEALFQPGNCVVATMREGRWLGERQE
jgi:cytosine/adenosine deaminase-related metal-dependent hydrolase